MERCESCGLEYGDMRTGLTFTEVRGMVKQTKRWGRRRGVLGLWRELKLQLWSVHLGQCEVPF